MAWVTPVTDRVESDVTTPTTKGFFNVADWTRINGNVLVIKSMMDAAGYVVASLTSLTPPTVVSYPKASTINPFVNNIEKLREAAHLPASVGLAVLKHDYTGGANEIIVPDYETVNEWEENLLILYTNVPRASGYFVQCGVPAVGQSRLWQHRFR